MTISKPIRLALLVLGIGVWCSWQIGHPAWKSRPIRQDQLEFYLSARHGVGLTEPVRDILHARRRGARNQESVQLFWSSQNASGIFVDADQTTHQLLGIMELYSQHRKEFHPIGYFEADGPLQVEFPEGTLFKYAPQYGDNPATVTIVVPHQTEPLNSE